MNERDMQTMNDQDLVNGLCEHAEWARANEWETPITLGDDLTEAADRIEAQAKEIEKLRAQLRHLCRNCDLDRLEKLAEADRDGRVVVRPCKVGDTVYRIVRDADPHIARDEVRNIYFADDMTLCVELVGGRIILSEKFGKTVFLTREEAERALEAMKDGNG